MTPERWQRIRGVFDTAASLSGTKLEDFLRRECGGDPELDAEVRRMLGEREKSGFIDRSPAAAARANAVFQPGAIVSGRYRILRTLGHGGMGEVFEGEDLELHEHVALKTLLPEIASDGRMIDRFKQEIQLSRKLAHPNICRVFDLARHPADGSSPDTVFFLTMEYLPGETLAERLRRDTRLAPAEALDLLEQMAAGLEAAHGAGVIHRDFKPSNVMLTESAAGTRAVLMDFGLARKVDRGDESTATISGQLIGTVDYMSPELFTGGKASAASDLYALGLVAYKMVTGSFPFESDAPLAAVIRRAGQKVPPARTVVPDLDPRWDDALARALDPDPARRFASVRDFLRALRGDTASVTVKLPVVTRRRAVFGVAAAVLAVAGAFGWRTWQTARSRPSPEAMSLYQKGVDDLHAGAYFAAMKALEGAVSAAPAFALAHARLAEAYVELDLTEKASREMLLARRQDLSSLSRANRLDVEAIDLTITREFAAAVAKYQQIPLSEDPGVRVDLARAYEKAGEPEKAIESYLRAAQSPGQNPAAWLHLAILYNRSGSATKCDAAFQRAEQQYQLTSNLEGLTEVIFQRGSVATTRGQFAAGAQDLRRAMETSRLVGNVHQEVRSNLQLGVNAYASGDATLAQSCAREAIETARSNRIETLAIRGLVTLGLAYQRKRDYQGAEGHFQEALTLARTTHADRLLALALLSLAGLQDETAKPEAAADAREALSFYQRNRFTRETVQCYTIIGRSYRRRGDPENAIREFQSALTAAEQAQDHALVDLAEESLGNALSDLERYPEALVHFQRELAFSATSERKGYAGLHCGHTLWMLGRPAEATTILKAAENDSAKVLSLRLSVYRDLAYLALSQAHYAESAAWAHKALSEDTGQSVRANSVIARILGLGFVRSGHVAEGIRQCRKSLELATELGEPLEIFDANLAVAEALLANGDRRRCLGILANIQPAPGHAVSQWRLLALMAKADSHYIGQASEALRAIRQSWGESAVLQYLSRADLADIARPLLQTNPAIPK
jgi:tetratricopeptide (TPR) repeat protein